MRSAVGVPVGTGCDPAWASRGPASASPLPPALMLATTVPTLTPPGHPSCHPCAMAPRGPVHGERDTRFPTLAGSTVPTTSPPRAAGAWQCHSRGAVQTGRRFWGPSRRVLQSKQAGAPGGLWAPARPPGSVLRAGLRAAARPVLAAFRVCLRRAGAGAPAQTLPDAWRPAGLSPKLSRPGPATVALPHAGVCPEYVSYVGAVIALKTLQILDFDLIHCFTDE